MDARKAAEFVNTLRPDVAIPTHYGSIVGKPSDGEVFARLVKEPIKVEIKLQFND
jgi:L-ascorbate metabolism protein UlaG (beta-lactamase superfamily)